MSGTIDLGGFAQREQDVPAAFTNTGLPVQAPLGDVARAAFGDTIDQSLRYLRRRAAGMIAAEPDLYPESERQWAGPLLTAAEANERFGIPGHVQFTRPIAEYSARQIAETKRAELASQDVLDRAGGGAGRWSVRIAAGLAGGVLDPLNAATAFIPFVGPARAAAWLGQAGSRAARIGTAMRIGAIEGAAGAAILEPTNRLFAAEEQRDYTMLDTLLNVAFGGVLGAGLHGAGRAGVDWARGWAPRPGSDPAVAHEAIVRAAVQAVAEGREVPATSLARLFGSAYRDGLMGGTSLSPPAARLAGFEPAAVAEDPMTASPALAELVADRAGVRAPVLDGQGEPVIAFSRKEEAELAARLAREGHGGVTWHRFEDQPGAYATARVPGVEVHRAENGEPRFYPSISRAKTAAKQLKGDWFPVEMPEGSGEMGVALMRAGAADQPRLVANRRGLEVGPAFLRPDLAAPKPLSSAEARALVQDAARQTVRESVARVQADTERAWARVSGENPRLREPAPGATPEPPKEVATVTQEMDAILAEHIRAGRITEADMAPIREAEKMEAHARERAKGYDAAAACLIGNGA